MTKCNEVLERSKGRPDKEKQRISQTLLRNSQKCHTMTMAPSRPIALNIQTLQFPSKYIPQRRRSRTSPIRLDFPPLSPKIPLDVPKIPKILHRKGEPPPRPTQFQAHNSILKRPQSSPSRNQQSIQENENTLNGTRVLTQEPLSYKNK